MTRLSPAIALIVLGALAASCTAAGGGFNARPADVYSIVPSMGDVRTLMGDSAWWAGPPSFEVRPLDAETTPGTVKFSVSEDFVRMGTAEELFARYTVYDKTSSATSTMTSFKTAFGQSPSSPRVGDDVLYYPVAQSGGGAPYVTRTFVRVGQVILTLVWARKDNNTKVDMLGKNAKLFAANMRALSKVHASVTPVETKSLPPPGRLITFLGAAKLPIEAFVTLTRTGLSDYLLNQLHQAGIASFDYGDYALNNDTHMEVQTALVDQGTAVNAAALTRALRPSADPDANGIYSGYIPIGGTPAAGVYMYVTSAGQYSLMVICKSSVEGEAASKECEAPTHDTIYAWKVALGG